LDDLDSLNLGLERSVFHLIEVKRLKIQQFATSHILHSPLEKLREFQQTLDDLTERLLLNCKNLFESAKQKLEIWKAQLKTLNPEAVLARGYSIVMKPPQKEVVKEARQVRESDALEIMLWKGTLEARITKTHPPQEIRNDEGEEKNES
jgi:exodeoxyribonuclease VII large subunit